MLPVFHIFPEIDLPVARLFFRQRECLGRGRRRTGPCALSSAVISFPSGSWVAFVARHIFGPFRFIPNDTLHEKFRKVNAFLETACRQENANSVDERISAGSLFAGREPR
jgi:hypothetical protein